MDCVWLIEISLLTSSSIDLSVVDPLRHTACRKNLSVTYSMLEQGNKFCLAEIYPVDMLLWKAEDFDAIFLFCHTNISWILWP